MKKNKKRVKKNGIEQESQEHHTFISNRRDTIFIDETLLKKG